jgi:hypothetical protein
VSKLVLTAFTDPGEQARIVSVNRAHLRALAGMMEHLTLQTPDDRAFVQTGAFRQFCETANLSSLRVETNELMPLDTWLSLMRMTNLRTLEWIGADDNEDEPLLSYVDDIDDIMVRAVRDRLVKLVMEFRNGSDSVEEDALSETLSLQQESKTPRPLQHLELTIRTEFSLDFGPRVAQRFENLQVLRLRCNWSAKSLVEINKALPKLHTLALHGHLPREWPSAHVISASCKRDGWRELTLAQAQLEWSVVRDKTTAPFSMLLLHRQWDVPDDNADEEEHQAAHAPEDTELLASMVQIGNEWDTINVMVSQWQPLFQKLTELQGEEKRPFIYRHLRLLYHAHGDPHDSDWADSVRPWFFEGMVQTFRRNVGAAVESVLIENRTSLGDSQRSLFGLPHRRRTFSLQRESPTHWNLELTNLAQESYIPWIQHGPPLHRLAYHVYPRLTAHDDEDAQAWLRTLLESNQFPAQIAHQQATVCTRWNTHAQAEPVTPQRLIALIERRESKNKPSLLEEFSFGRWILTRHEGLSAGSVFDALVLSAPQLHTVRVEVAHDLEAADLLLFQRLKALHVGAPNCTDLDHTALLKLASRNPQLESLSLLMQTTDLGRQAPDEKTSIWIELVHRLPQLRHLRLQLVVSSLTLNEHRQLASIGDVGFVLQWPAVGQVGLARPCDAAHSALALFCVTGVACLLPLRVGTRCGEHGASAIWLPDVSACRSRGRVCSRTWIRMGLAKCTGSQVAVARTAVIQRGNQACICADNGSGATRGRVDHARAQTRCDRSDGGRPVDAN